MESLHVRTASIAADFAEDEALIAWTSSLQSTIAFWQGRYRAAASIAQQARNSGPAGVETARLACLEARAWAMLGDRSAMHSALDAGWVAAEQDGPAAGVGFIAFPRANQVRVAATALLWAGEHRQAQAELTQALAMLADEYASPAHLAVARFDLADAHVRAASLDDCASALQPLFNRSDGYLAGAARRAAGLVERLGAASFADSAVARQLVDDIQAFLAGQHTNGDAARAGVTSDRRLP